MFDPPLVDNVNCLVYRTEEEALCTIRKGLESEPEEINRMRKNVLNYYDAYLKPENFKKRLATLDNPLVTLIFNIEKTSVDLLLQKQNLTESGESESIRYPSSL